MLSLIFCILDNYFLHNCSCPFLIPNICIFLLVLFHTQRKNCPRSLFFHFRIQYISSHCFSSFSIVFFPFVSYTVDTGIFQCRVC
nr:MAG TPA: hypothetical protein [Caudoviricetes sp.]